MPRSKHMFSFEHGCRRKNAAWVSNDFRRDLCVATPHGTLGSDGTRTVPAKGTGISIPLNFFNSVESAFLGVNSVEFRGRFR